MKKGILIIAAGHPNYGRMAAALAASLKATGTKLPIHLAYTTRAISHLGIEEMRLFDMTHIIPAEYMEPALIRAKLFMYELSPFAETLFLDADIVWFKKQPDELFDILLDRSFTISNHGPAEVSQWADLKEIRKMYELSAGTVIYNIHSECVLFKKCKEVKKYFSLARKINDTLKVESTVFAGGIPDELPLMISGAILNITPHDDTFRPIWWENTDRNSGKQFYHLYGDFYGMSMGGNSQGSVAKNSYNLVSAAAYIKMKLPAKAYKWQRKKDFLPERAHI